MLRRLGVGRYDPLCPPPAAIHQSLTASKPWGGRPEHTDEAVNAHSRPLLAIVARVVPILPAGPIVAYDRSGDVWRHTPKWTHPTRTTCHVPA